MSYSGKTLSDGFLSETLKKLSLLQQEGIVARGSLLVLNIISRSDMYSFILILIFVDVKKVITLHRWKNFLSRVPKKLQVSLLDKPLKHFFQGAISLTYNLKCML